MTVDFDASASSDPDLEPITSYEWDFDKDGSTDATGVTTQYVFNTPGVFTVKLTVSDDDGAEGEATTYITVNGLFAPGYLVQPADTSNYTGFNATFSVEVWVLDGSSALFRDAMVLDSDSQDQIRIKMTNGSDRRIYGALFWDKADFLNLSGADALGFNGSSRLYIDVAAVYGGFPKLRFMVRDGTQFYLSDAYTDSAGEFELTGTALADTLWAAYDPETNLQPDPGNTGVQSDGLTYDVTTDELTNLTGMGFFVERSSFPAAGNQEVRVEDFEAYGHVVVEPAAGLLFWISDASGPATVLNVSEAVAAADVIMR